MIAGDAVLELSRVAIALSLAVWIGGTAMAAVVAARLFTRLPSRAQAGEIFGEILAVLDKAKFIAAGALLIGVLLEVQTMGSSLPPRRIVRAALLFVLIASHVYAVMVVQPKMRYYRERIGDLDAAPADGAWRIKLGHEHRKSSVVTGTGLFLAVAAVVVG